MPVRLRDDVPQAAKDAGERRAGLGLESFGQVLVLFVSAPKQFGATTVRSFKGWWPRSGGSSAWFDVREPAHVQLLDTLGEGSQVYVLGAMQVKERNGRTFISVRVAQLEKVDPVMVPVARASSSDARAEG